MTRRYLIEAALVVAAAAATPLLPLFRGTLPRRTLEAVRARAYPGRLRPLDLADVRRPSSWLG